MGSWSDQPGLAQSTQWVCWLVLWGSGPGSAALQGFGRLASGGTMCFIFRLLCRDLGGCFLVGESALLSGRLNDALEVGKAQGCSCVGSVSVPRVPRGDDGEGLVCRAEENWVGHRSSHPAGPFWKPWLGFICLVALCSSCSCPKGWTAAWRQRVMGEPVMGCLACAGTETGFPSATHPGAVTFPFLGQETLGLGCGA